MTEKDYPAAPVYNGSIADGFTAIEYAAILLREPTCGNPWLDDMIRKANRRDMATAIGSSYALSEQDGEDMVRETLRLTDILIAELSANRES